MSLGIEGNWKLSKEGSDYLPGIDKLQGSPIVLKLKGQNSEVDNELLLYQVTIMLSYCIT